MRYVRLREMDVILANFPMNDHEDHPVERETEMKSKSDELQGNVTTLGEAFWFVLKTNYREKSEITVTVELTNSEMASQMSKNLDEIKTKRKPQILQAINSAINKNVLPNLQDGLGMPKIVFSTKVELWSDALHMKPESETNRKTPKYFSKMESNQSNLSYYRSESSVDYQHSYLGYNITGFRLRFNFSGVFSAALSQVILLD